MGAYESCSPLHVIEENVMGDSYNFNGTILHEPGYYTTTYATADCDSVVGLHLDFIESTIEMDGITLWPNPTKDKVNIDAPNIQHISVMNVTGQTVYNGDMDDSIVTLNLSQYGAGIYIIRITTANGIMVRRVSVE